MAKDNKQERFPFGEFLKWAREQKGVSLKEAEKATGIPNAYLSQLETGARKKLPPPDRLQIIAEYYNVSPQELLYKAGYFKKKDIKETQEDKLDKALTHALSDPLLKTGTRVNIKNLSADAKRFIVEVYKNVKHSSVASTAYYHGDDYPKQLMWSVESVKRSVIKDNPTKHFVKYEVAVGCFIVGTISPEDAHRYPEIDPQGIDPDTHEVQLDSVSGKAEVIKPFYLPAGHETALLEQATNMALRNALKDVKDVNWIDILFKESKEMSS